ncbi:polysaccharide lyase family 7 protein [Tenacibaculum sp. M341]|uniref:polysaccharide lyase family 7 protein n=1 Tax=Tenacibaculum sp. M341 TaxID=2530339 RepID=UPI0010505F2B|nr:polysaccharide lyase family 7 protein [Tenacibaculum sp. M341]TCI85690.1 polysaccharide lyase family 7 protein [Tenacibaculum sp. M341]
MNKPIYILLLLAIIVNGCKKEQETQNNKTKTVIPKQYPSAILSHLSEMKILLGNGKTVKDLENFENNKYFFITKEDGENWVVFKTPNSGITSKNSKNTRTELHQNKEWTPETGGKLTGTLKVKHVSTSGDARVGASFSVVVGQIHSGEGHKNEPLKIFYKKFPGHKKGSVYWNYEINTKGSNSERWDHSTAVWGYDMSVVGEKSDVYPQEPSEGIALDEEFYYEVNVHKGIMYLTFKSKNHETKTFTKSLIDSDFKEKSDIPEKVKKQYAVIDRDGVEQPNAYKNELQYFKQGAYNQTNGKNPETNLVWSTGANIYNGDLEKQYANGSYAEVWFKSGTLGEGSLP